MLEGVRIIDFTRLLPGPYATGILADYGAEVIKVEEPKRGDYSREYGTQVNGSSVMFNSLNRGKESIVANLYHEDEREFVLELIKTADIVIESFRPGFMKRIGLEYESVAHINPSVIYCSVTGFGQTGPFVNKAGHDLTYLSYSGLLDAMYKGMERRDSVDVVPPLQISDVGAAQNIISGLLIAYIHRLKTGEGQYLDISILDGIYSSCMQLILPEYMVTKRVPTVENNSLNGDFANYCTYRTKDNRFLSVAAIEKKFWRKFCEGIEMPEYTDLIEDDEKMKEVRKAVQQIIEERTLGEWMKKLEMEDACVAPVIKIEEIRSSKQVVERGLIDSKAAINNPLKFSTIKIKSRERVPSLGEDTQKYMKELEPQEV